MLKIIDKDIRVEKLQDDSLVDNVIVQYDEENKSFVLTLLYKYGLVREYIIR